MWEPWERLNKASHLPPIQSGPEKISSGYSKGKKNTSPQKVGPTLKKAWRKGLPDCGVAGGLKSRRGRVLHDSFQLKKSTMAMASRMMLQLLHLTSQGSTDNNFVATIFVSKYLGFFMLPWILSSDGNSSQHQEKNGNSEKMEMCKSFKKPWFPSCRKGTLSQTVSCDLVWHEPN